MASKAIGFLNFKFGADLGGFEKAMNKAQKKLKKFGKSVEKTGKNLTTSLTLPIIALGGASLKTFADFEQGMLKVKAISGATDLEFKALTESAKELGSTTMFTASQVAELQLNLSKLGLTPEQINQSTEAVLNLAQATDSDLGQAATVTAKIMNAFGMEATDMTRITDVMADAFSSTALDMTKFETAMASVAPVAKMAGSDLEQTSAILGVLVNNGVEASTAGTALRNIFLDLAKSGKTWDQAMGEINSSTNPLAVSMEMFGKRGANVATILAQSGVEVQALTQDFRDSTGEAQAMADIMDSGVAGSIRKMISQLEGVAIELGEKLIPIFEIVIDKISKMVKWFTSLSDEQQKSIVKWGLIIAAIGPVLFIIGKLSIAFASLIGILKTIGGFLLANPYISLAVGIGVVVVALTDWTDGLFGVSEAQKAVNDINNMASKAIIGQKVEVDLLTTALKDENATLEDKETALNSLNTIAPEYYGKLNAATLDVKALDTATKNYTDSILQQAIAEASMTKLKELNSQLLEFELSGVKKGSKMYNLFTADIQNQITAVMDLINANKKLESSTDKVVKTEIAEEIDLKIPTKKITTTKITKEIEKTTKSFEDFQSSIDDTSVVWDTYAHSMSNAEDQFAGIVFWQTELTDNQKLLNAGMGMFGDVLTSSLDSALNSQENFFDVFIKNIKKAITSLLIQLAVMSLINMMMGGGAAAFSIASLKANLGSLIGVPAFAEGGLVTGPTTALIGEGVGTNAGNPEVVAPLDKLKSMMGGGNNNIVVTGKLIGSDIFLSNQNASNNRLRTT